MMYRNFFICLFLVFTYGCSDSNNDDGFDLSPVDPPANPVTTANANQPGWLYVQTEATAQMTSDTTLEIPFTREVFGFADRPDRRSAYFTASEFEAFWSEEGANSFTEDPPNAVLTWLNGEEQREAEVIINNATVYSDGVQESLVYEVTVETGQMPDAQMSSVSLFVDSSSGAATLGVEVEVCTYGVQACTPIASAYDIIEFLKGLEDAASPEIENQYLYVNVPFDDDDDALPALIRVETCVSVRLGDYSLTDENYQNFGCQ